jgi:hypothetical protein
MTLKKSVGRPRKYKKAITIEEIKMEKKRKSNYIINTRDKDKYNQYMRNFRKKKIALKKEDIYREIKDEYNIEHLKLILYRMSRLIKIGCIEKKTDGNNYITITRKMCFGFIMKLIGFTNEKDTWISRDWLNIPMRILKWKDIKRNKIHLDKMILFGVLSFKLNIPSCIATIIMDYYDDDKNITQKFKNNKLKYKEIY